MMAGVGSLIAFALLGAVLAALVNWGADVLLPSDNEVPRPSTLLGAIAGARGSTGSLRPNRHLWVILIGVVGGAAVAWRFGATGTGLWLLGWGALLLLITVIDFEHRLVLNRVLLVAGAVALVAGVVGLEPAVPVLQSLLGGVAGLALFFIIALLGRGAMGAGDVKLAGFIGLLLGFPAVFNALLLGVVFGGLAALAAILMGRGRKSTIAYAPWLSLGALVVLVQAAAAVPA